jgi:hypothetical protein
VNWKPQHEASGLVVLALRGEMDYAAARELILMTPSQLEEIIGEGLAPEPLARKLFEMRKMTWECFELMYRQAMGKAASA